MSKSTANWQCFLFTQSQNLLQKNRSFSPEIQKRGVLNHTPDGIYSSFFPAPAGFDHPMFVNWGSDVYPSYNEEVLKFLQEKRPCVLTTGFAELPGYTLVYGFKHFEKEFRFFVPEN